MKGNYSSVMVYGSELKGDLENIANRVENTLQYFNGYYLQPADKEAKEILAGNPIQFILKISQILERRKNEN